MNREGAGESTKTYLKVLSKNFDGETEKNYIKRIKIADPLNRLQNWLDITEIHYHTDKLV
jgi:hypothetical protein